MRISFIILSAMLVLSACSNRQEVDRIFIGGTIHTANDAQAVAQMLAVDNGRIVFVGDASSAGNFNAAIVTDLKGAHLYPGFTDAHAHLSGIGLRESSLNLEGSKSLQEMLEWLADAAEAQKQGVLIGRGWIETHWPENRPPDRKDLDAIVPGRPVVLARADGHAYLLNSSALEMVGIDKTSIDPQGGRIERDASGQPNGILVDKAMDMASPLFSEPSAQRRRQILQVGAKVMASYGWTGVHNMSVSKADMTEIEALAEAGLMPIRVYNGIVPEDISVLAAGGRFIADDRVITRAIKIITDGALGSRGAALLAPYADQPSNTGLMLALPEETGNLLRKALQEGWQINAHAIGDRANREILDWMEQAFTAIPVAERKVPDPRWRVEHAQIIDPADIPRFAELGIIPSMQPSHAIGDLFFAEDRLGVLRLKGAYAWQGLIDNGSIIVAGSDAPVERGDPRIEFYGAIARTALTGFQGENWHKEQAVSRDTALKMFTLWPAIASFREDELGSIEIGKRADFTVFDRDLMSVPAKEVLDAVVLWTIVDGKDSYKAKTSVP